jgi:indoleamine 2,3-dioxygenase
MALQSQARLSLAPYDISADRGFLPAQDPLPSIFQGYSLNALSRDLPKYLAARKFRDFLMNTSRPVLAEGHPLDMEAARAAFRMLSFASHGFVWEDPTHPADRLPAALAVPWHRLAYHLGRPPVLSYASYALDNWRRLDPEGPIALGNIVLIQNFLGGLDEEWFVLIHVDIEAKAGPALFGIVQALEGARLHRMDAVIVALGEVATALEDMCRTLRRMPERCEPYIYYHRVRPYIHGWKDNPALPQGLLYEDVEEYRGQPRHFRGETGAQSSVIPALDAGLGIRHEEGPLTRYLLEMRDYMPPQHRTFIGALEAQHDERYRPLLSGYVADHQRRVPELWTAYATCVELVVQFRAIHIDYADRYIYRQTEQNLNNPHRVGTGGTPFMQYLDKHLQETKQRLTRKS